MILTNETIAAKIFNFNSNNCILRKHEKKDYDINKEIIDNQLRKYLEIMESNAASYICNFDENNYSHDSLNIKLYTHFTSPIRRYADIIIHRIMNQIITNNKKNGNWDSVCNQMNNVNKNIRKFERDIDKINFISQNLNNQVFEAFITEIKPITRKIQIFIKENKLSFYINIFSDKLKEIIICNFEKKYFEISYKDKEIKNRFYLFQKINILVSTRLEANNIDKKSIISLLDNQNTKIIDLLV